MTEDEQTAIQMAGDLWNHLVQKVVGQDSGQDLNELASAIHLIQRYVMSNAAAREHPDLYRALGETLGPKP